MFGVARRVAIEARDFHSLKRFQLEIKEKLQTKKLNPRNL